MAKSNPKVNKKEKSNKKTEKTPKVEELQVEDVAPVNVVEEVQVDAEVPVADAPVEKSSFQERCDIFESKLEEIRVDLTNRVAEDKKMLNVVKDLLKEHRRIVKEAGKKHKKKHTGDKSKRKPSGFTLPGPISPELANFLEVEKDTQIARTQVTKLINAYVKKNNLQDPDQKRVIVPDNKLKKLLGSPKEEVTFFNLQKFMKVHYPKVQSQVQVQVQS